jgi:hypothetical protein
MYGAASSAARVAVRRVALPHHDGRNAHHRRVEHARNCAAAAPDRFGRRMKVKCG